MSLKSFFDKFREEEKKRQQEELASLNTNVNVFKNTPANTQSSTVKATAKSGTGTGGSTSKVQSNTAKSSAKSTSGNTSKNKRNTDAIDMDWGLNAKAYADMTSKLKKVSVNKSTDMIDDEYGFNVKAMDDYLAKMRSGRKAEANKGAVIYGDVSDKIKDNKYADTMIKIGKSFSDFGKYNHLNDLYYIDNPTGVDEGYKYITKNDMNKYFYALASHEKGDTDKKDVDDLKKYLFGIGTKIDSKEADELPPIKNKPDYSKISSEEQLIYDSYGNAVNKAKSIDYSSIPTDDQLPKEPGKIKVDKSTDAVDRDYGLDLSSYKDLMSKIKSSDTYKPKRDIDYSKISSEEQLIYDSFGNAVNKAKKIDYSDIPTDDQFTDDVTDKAIDKAKGIDYNKIYDSYGFDVSSDYDELDKTDKEFQNYLIRTRNQLVEGKESGDVTLLGTLTLALLGTVGLDMPFDLRDITYDLDHWEDTPEHKTETAIDLIGIIPFIGDIKYVDDAFAIIKNAVKNSDVVIPVLKQAYKKVTTMFPSLRNIVKYSDDAEYLDDIGDISKEAGKVVTEIKYKPSSGVLLKATPDKTTTIIGSFEKDMEPIIKEIGNIKSTDFGAKNGGFNVLNVPDEYYKTSDQFWQEYNKPWLDEAIKRGDNIIIATKPEGDFLSYYDRKTGEMITTGFGREYKYLLEKGYLYDAKTNMMIHK